LFIKEKDRLDNTKLNIDQQLESAENEIAHTDMKNQKLKRDLTKMNSEIQTLDKTIEENVALSLN
jgi:peptidoglycan hydrolase CwlO-like protein